MRDTPLQAGPEFAGKLDDLRVIVERLQSSTDNTARPVHPRTEAVLVQCAREVMWKEKAMHQSGLALRNVAGGPGVTTSNLRVAEWVSTLESLRRDQQPPSSLNVLNSGDRSSFLPGDDGSTRETNAIYEHHVALKHEGIDALADDSDNDLDTEFTKAALEAGASAFESQEWDEAETFLQEALRALQQLSKHQRMFCDIFTLQYKLAVCSYHTQQPTEAKEALLSLLSQPVNSDEQRAYVSNATHMLAHLYIRTRQFDSARFECEKALQMRRRLLGKRSDAALESTALLAHVYILLNNRARARLCIGMIPEERRDAVVNGVEEQLGTRVEHLDPLSPQARSASEDSGVSMQEIQSRLNATALTMPMEKRCFGPVTTTLPQSPTSSLRHSYQRVPSIKATSDYGQSATVTSMTSLSSAEEIIEPRAIITQPETASEQRYRKGMNNAEVETSHSNYPEAVNTSAPTSGSALEVARGLSRKEILEKVGCQPRDSIEQAVCDSDHLTFVNLLNKRKGSWRSKIRKTGRPERVTALHFAALFGEIDMARRLLTASYNVNDVPFGYSTSLTPLKFAIGARQVDMVDFLVSEGARPSDPDSWSTLAGQLMNRSWLMKTMSESEKEFVPTRMVAILRILLKYGWNINAPFETSGRTVLHQAVTFWTGSYKWDLNLRAVLTSFLCEEGANPLQANAEGKTPYDLASASGHQELLLILDRGPNRKRPNPWPAELVELPTEPAVRA